MPLLPFVFLFALASAARTAVADESRCTPMREGEVACLAGKLCECRHDPGGVLAGRPAASRWDCGALRPACGATPEAGTPERSPLVPPPAILPVPPFPQPEWR